jgi:hypothetical protein
MLVVDINGYFPLGFSAIHCWNRRFDKKNRNQRDYKNLPIEQKESYRWISTGTENIDLLKESVAHMTIIGDRESDIYQEFIDLKSANSDLLVRSKENRELYGEENRLNEYLSEQPISGTYKISVRSEKRKNRESRNAIIDVKYC